MWWCMEMQVNICMLSDPSILGISSYSKLCYCDTNLGLGWLQVVTRGHLKTNCFHILSLHYSINSYFISIFAMLCFPYSYVCHHLLFDSLTYACKYAMYKCVSRVCCLLIPKYHRHVVATTALSHRTEPSFISTRAGSNGIDIEVSWHHTVSVSNFQSIARSIECRLDSSIISLYLVLDTNCNTYFVKFIHSC